MAPGITDDAATGEVIHHLALGHGRAVQAFRAAGSPGEIGPCFALSSCYPADDSAEAARQTAVADVGENTVSRLRKRQLLPADRDRRTGTRQVYWPTSASGQQIPVEGLRDLTLRVHRDYRRPLIITETGIPNAAGVAPLAGQYRIELLHDHLLAPTGPPLGSTSV